MNVITREWKILQVCDGNKQGNRRTSSRSSRLSLQDHVELIHVKKSERGETLGSVIVHLQTTKKHISQHT